MYLYNGIVEVSGSIPLSSTKLLNWFCHQSGSIPLLFLPETFDLSGNFPGYSSGHSSDHFSGLLRDARLAMPLWPDLVGDSV